MTGIYLGEPPKHIKDWIVAHYSEDGLDKPLRFTSCEDGCRLKLNDPMAKSLYMDNPYSTKCYNEPIDIVPFEKMNIVEDLIINQSFVLDNSKAVFAKIE